MYTLARKLFHVLTSTAELIGNGIKSVYQALMPGTAQDHSEAKAEPSQSLGNLLQALFPGLKNAGPEMSAEFSRLGTQGSMELASALFNGHSFVPYGPGQYTPSTPEHEQTPQEHQHEREMER